MNALFVTPYPPKPDGIGEHSRGLVDALRRVDGTEVDVLTVRHPESDVAMPGVHRILSADPRSTGRAVALMDELVPDIVHYQFAIPAFGLAAVSAIAAGVRARRAHPEMRIVITFHEVRRELDLLGPLGRGIYRTLVGAADAVIVHTTDARDLVSGECGGDPQRVWLTPLGGPPPPPGSLDPAVVASVQDRYGLAARGSGGRPLVLCFGFLHPDKGLEHVVDAVAALRDRDAIGPEGLDLMIAGTVRPRSGVFRCFGLRDHEYELELRRSVERLGLTDLIRFVGFVDSADAPALFALARVVVVPYTKVTQSSVLDTATVAGAPVVASDLPGLRESLGDGGLLVPPGDAGALAAALERVLTDDELERSLRARQEQRARLIGFDTVAAGLVGIYDSVRTAPSRVGERRSVGVG